MFTIYAITRQHIYPLVNLLILTFSLLLPLLIFAEDIQTPTTPVKLLIKESQQTTTLKAEQTNTKEVSQSIEEQIDSQTKLLEEILLPQ